MEKKQNIEKEKKQNMKMMQNGFYERIITLLEEIVQKNKADQNLTFFQGLRKWFIELIKNPTSLVSVLFTVVVFFVGSNYNNSMNNVNLKLSGTQMNKIVKNDEGWALNPYIAFKLKKQKASGEPQNFYLGRYEDDEMTVKEVRTIKTLPNDNEQFSKLTIDTRSTNLTTIQAVIQKPKYWNQFNLPTKKQEIGYKRETYKNTDLVLFVFDPAYMLNMSSQNKRSYVGYYHLISQAKNGSYQVITFIHKQSGKEDEWKDITETFYGLEIYDETLWQDSTFEYMKDEVIGSYNECLSFVKNQTIN
ncbi:hypothetical protein [Candidatus Enterococcus murrayae]|uniref:Uncharacterized protein n=1 Tax=Candidatus Enterococcus murrayae TaxID=2815321 RepID=A0ABS3HER4_9ENTE|nr:hypothetical protein [Enterococcus sp. MJM16]MBO0451941.1 hypothetical protein [Enterococcus sp. MJM16]